MEVDNSKVKKKMCFRCSSEDHFIRDCLKPDTQGEKEDIQDMNVEKCQRLITTMLDEVTPWSNSRAR
jgi:hypothetical protein